MLTLDLTENRNGSKIMTEEEDSMFQERLNNLLRQVSLDEIMEMWEYANDPEGERELDLGDLEDVL